MLHIKRKKIIERTVVLGLNQRTRIANEDLRSR